MTNKNFRALLALLPDSYTVAVNNNGIPMEYTVEDWTALAALASENETVEIVTITAA